MSPLVQSLVVSLVLLAPVVLCIKVGKWLLGAFARLWCSGGSTERRMGVAPVDSSADGEEPLRFRYGGARRLDRTTNSTWVFRDM